MNASPFIRIPTRHVAGLVTLLGASCLIAAGQTVKPIPIPEPPMNQTAPRPALALASPTNVTLRIGEPVHRYPLLKEWPASKGLKHPAIAFRRDAEGHLVLSIPLAEGEAIWGFGQRFDAFNLRGKNLEIWTTDGWNNPDTSYFAVPFFISSTGYGLMVNCPGRLTFDIGKERHDWLTITVPESGVELLVFQGDPATVSRAYTETVGRPRAVPAWVFRPWISRNSYLGAYEIDRVIRRMRELEMPIGVMVLEAWAEELHNFRFTTHRYPNPEAWIARLHEDGVRVVNWITSSVWQGTRAYNEAKERGFLVLNEDGSEHVVRWLENGRKIDFRIPEARDWWRDLHKPLIEMGVDGFKTDGGEHMPDPFFHNQHPFYYQQASLDAFRDLGREGITFARSANPLCAGLGAFWAGDQHAEWSRLAMVVRGSMSAALSGFFLWTHDIGAYTGDPVRELYIRWLQFGVFSPLMQFHGIEAREPWHFDDETIAIARFYFRVRERLLPHLEQWGEAALTEGHPILRPLVWHFPEDAVTHDLDDQVMLGPDLLIAPLIDAAPGREVYLPQGEWVDLWTGETFAGPSRLYRATALHEIPVYARAEHAATYADLFNGAPPQPPPAVTLKLDGPRNPLGVAPPVRYWRAHEQTAEPIEFEVRNTTDREARVDVLMRAAAGVTVEPDNVTSITLAPGDVRHVAYTVRPAPDLAPGTYTVRLAAKTEDARLPPVDVELVIPHRWEVLGLFGGGVGSGQPLDGDPVRRDQTYEGRHGRTLSWRPVPPEAMNDAGVFNLDSITGGDGSSSTYLYTTLHAERHGGITFKAGFGDAMTVWLNGQEIKSVQGHRNADRDEDVFDGVLKAGANHLMIRNSRDLAPPRFFFRSQRHEP